MNKFGMVALLALVPLIPAGYCQTTPAMNGAAPAAQKSDSPTIVTNVDEVTIDLVAREKNSKTVLDLKPADITITDGGSAVKLSDLRLVTAQSGTGRLITLVFDRFQPSSARNARDIATKILKFIPANDFSLSVLSVGGRL